MHQENNAPFMTKNVNFTFFPWTLLGHSKKGTDISLFQNAKIHGWLRFPILLVSSNLVSQGLSATKSRVHNRHYTKNEVFDY